MEKPVSNWMEIARLVRAVIPHSQEEADILLNRYDAGELPAEELVVKLRALRIRR